MSAAREAMYGKYVRVKYFLFKKKKRKEYVKDSFCEFSSWEAMMARIYMNTCESFPTKYERNIFIIIESLKEWKS